MRIGDKHILNLAFIILTTLSTTVAASDYCVREGGCEYEFTPRSIHECSDLNPEMTSWFTTSDSELYSPFDKKIGPVRNQREIGWCFAHTAADMMAYETGHIISAAQIAKNYYTKSKIAWIWGADEGGLLNDAIKLSLNKPLCDENSFPTEGHNIHTAKVTECLKPVTTMSNFKVSLKASRGHSAGGILFPEIDHALANLKMVGIHYTSQKLFNFKRNLLVDGFADHVSSIVARYYDKEANSCRYIIRNSWGDSCSSIKNKNVHCKRGYYSVTEEELSNNLLSIVLLNKKK